jgi:hypothetical protein
MNERIEHCLYQAGLTAQGCWEDLDTYTQEGIEKFAELIIRHCASQVRFTDLLLCNDDSDGEILLQASVQLKRHFGVEE